jgi:deazaflavin-dependent oxidoreductase (nitroreductase family)
MRPASDSRSRSDKRNRRLLRAITGLHVAVYRASGGRVGHHLPGAAPILLLDHVGAQSGRRHTTPVAYMREDHNIIVVGANLGAATDPGWVHNLRAHPHTDIQIASAKRPVRARQADPEERQRLWAAAVRQNPAWGRYQARTDRTFPMMILRPIGVATTRRTCETDA